MTRSPDNVAVSCRAVTKDYGAGNSLVRALRGIDLDIHAGELTLLMGPSGCGKTTLLSVIAAILEQTSGTVSVMGDELSKMSDRRKLQFRGKNLGFVFQQFNLLPALTATENVAVPLLIQGWSRGKALVRAGQVLDSMGMGERRHSLPTKLSGGQQQRVAIARALVHEPHVLVCDEPTSALDAKTGHTIMRLLRNVALERDRAVIVVTHDSRVVPFGDRIAQMEDGRITDIVEQSPNDRALAEAESLTHIVHPH